MRSWRLVAVLLMITVTIAVSVAAYWFYVDSLSHVEHNTDRWAIIEDLNKDRMTLERLSDRVWFELLALRKNGTQRYIGGIVERDDNQWGFRFNPDSVKVAEFIADELRATIRLISADVEDWVNRAHEHEWHVVRTPRARYAYVGATVVEMHSAS